MCLFTYANKSSRMAFAKGVEKFECGSCPECLQKKSRKWALRCAMEAKVSNGVMVTLTYDTYKVIDGKESNEENPVNPNLSLSKEDCQLFIKRLRKKFKNQKIKYLLTAERGKRTNRAHYHALLFGVQFDDLVRYKKSSRNNIIYKSKTLEALWKKGICTVDCINLSAKTARYCTKYCAKDSGTDDTFMLFSRGIGDIMLKKLFNGRNYWIDGREYSVPREIWQWYIERKYNLPGYSKYKGKIKLETCEKLIFNGINKTDNDILVRNIWIKRLSMLENRAITYNRQYEKRQIYFRVRDNDKLYQRYLAYWKRKNEVNNISRPNEFARILALPSMKYWSYKQKAIYAKSKQFKRRFFIPPRSNCSGFDPFLPKKEYEEKSFAPLSRHYTANDTMRDKFAPFIKELNRLRYAIMQENAKPLAISPF